jgi:DHA2 family methylenomycin A resistance protein-like MFS transporter
MERHAWGRDDKLIILATSLATFIGILDSSIVNVGLHAIQTALHVGIPTLQWVVDGYNLVYAAFILMGGALGDRYGRKRIFLLGTAILGIGSLLCAVAPSGTVLVAGRIISGFGAAFQLSTALALVATAFQGADQTRAIAVWISVNGLAVGIGPTVGGVLIEGLGWRSMFYFMLPFIGLSGWLGARHIPESRDPSAYRVDVAGQVAAVVALGALCIGLIEAPAWGWANARTIAAFVIAALSTVAFIIRERVTPAPMLPLGIFSSATLSAAVACAACMTFGWYTFLFLFPLYLQLVLAHSPVRAGIDLIPRSIGFFIVSAFLTARLVARFGPQLVVGIALIVVALCLLGSAHMTSNTPYITTALQLLGMGVGFALAAGPLSNLGVANAPGKHAGVVSGLLNAGRMIGAMLGVAIVGTMLGERAGVRITPAMLSQGMRTALTVAFFVEAAGAALAFAVFRRDSLSRTLSAPQREPARRGTTRHSRNRPTRSRLG